MRSALAANHTRARMTQRWLISLPEASKMAMARNTCGQTALHVCARHGRAHAAEHLLRLPDIDMDAVDNFGASPLVEAVKEEHDDVVGCLLSGKADVNIFVPNCHGHGDTALLLAVRLRNERLVQQLLAAPGIDLLQKSIVGVPFGCNALDFAPSSGPIRGWLLRAMASQKYKARQAAEQLLVASESAQQCGANVEMCMPSPLDIDERPSHGHPAHFRVAVWQTLLGRLVTYFCC